MKRPKIDLNFCRLNRTTCCNHLIRLERLSKSWIEKLKQCSKDHSEKSTKNLINISKSFLREERPACPLNILKTKKTRKRMAKEMKFNQKLKTILPLK